ncbi:MAG: DUF763 domain-containing protein [Candidatus Micrarchaeia archaeon]
MKTGYTDLPLHYGNAPKWLFSRMVELSRIVYVAIEREYGKDEFLKRISDPFWFQCLACVLGFDFHSSGTTTVTCGALKEALSIEEYGIEFLGGKGKSAINIKEEINLLSDRINISQSKLDSLFYASKISAKVDNSLIQDGYQLYHHSFIVTEEGRWAVIQQGLNSDTRYARRYHWLDEKVSDFVVEPHAAICCDESKECLNLTAFESEGSRRSIVDLVKEAPGRLIAKTKDLKQTTLLEYGFTMQSRHEIDLHLYQRLMDLNEFNPSKFEEIINYPGVGPKTIRALALLSELIYGSKPSWKDPVKYSFALGGKDGYPYPVDRKTYDNTIEFLNDAIFNSNLSEKEKLNAVKRLNNLYANLLGPAIL